MTYATAPDPRPFAPAMTPYRAVEIAENGAPDEDENAEETYLAAWQFLVDSGLAWTLQGWFGRTAMDMIRNGQITR